MNKKQLTESIMAGVKSAFRTNNALNEGFAAWKAQNAPKFPLDEFHENIKSLVAIWVKFIKNDYIKEIRFFISTESNGTALLSKLNKEYLKAYTGNDILEFIYNGEKSLQAKCEKGIEQFYRGLYKTDFKIFIDSNTTFGEFVKQTVIGGTNNIEGINNNLMEYGTIQDLLTLQIPTKALLDEENVKKLIEYFNDEE